MKSRLSAAVAALMISAGSAAAEESSSPTSLERFRLWYSCLPVILVVEELGNDAAESGLTVERIETLVRSRLRAPQIYKGNSAADGSFFTPWVYVNVNVVSSAYGIQFRFNKWLTDLVTDESGSAATWHKGYTGTHRQDASYILQAVSELTDIFIDEYLRVNAEAC